MAATRDGYGQALLDMATNEKVVVLEADLGKSTKSALQKSTPRRTVSCGIGEQHAANSGWTCSLWLHSIRQYICYIYRACI